MLKREKNVATVFRLLIVTHLLSAHFDVLSRASCILTFAVSVDIRLKKTFDVTRFTKVCSELSRSKIRKFLVKLAMI